MSSSSDDTNIKDNIREFVSEIKNMVRPEVKGFEDPENYKELIKNLSSCDTREKFMELINNVFPNWLVSELPEYSKDYPHLQTNWEAICRMNNVSRQSIVIVQDVAFRGDKVHLLLAELCEFMTKKGFIVRRKGEMIGCLRCNRAIPSEDIWSLMKQKKMPVPEEYGNQCSRC